MMEFREPINDEARKKLKELFGDDIVAMDEKKVLVSRQDFSRSAMSELADAARQPVSLNMLSGNEVVEMADGTKYKVTPKGWVKIKDLSPAEALYGFCAWLTTRQEQTIMSSRHDASPIAQLVAEFCETNKLEEPRDGWHNNLVHPSGECSGSSE